MYFALLGFFSLTLQLFAKRKGGSVVNLPGDLSDYVGK